MLVSSVWTARPAAAHDFWLEPSRFQVAEGRRVSLSFREGHGVGHPLPRNESRLERFELHGPAGVMAVPGADGLHPAGVVPAPPPGTYLVGYLNNAARHRLPAHRFESYLEEEGLAAISAIRRERGESEEVGSERYTRCAKTIFDVGSAPAGEAWSKWLGFPLELAPRSAPRATRLGSTIEVELRFRGEPLPGARVVAVARDGAGHDGDPIALHTDASGLVRLPVNQAGHWRVKAVHMEAAPAGAGVDWESWWASLTFEIDAGVAAGP